MFDKTPVPQSNYVCLSDTGQRFVGRYTNLFEVLRVASSLGAAIVDDTNLYTNRWFKLDEATLLPCVAPVSFIALVDLFQTAEQLAKEEYDFLVDHGKGE